MFFALSKIAWALIAPSTFLVVLTALGLLVSLRWRRVGLVVAVLGVAGLLVGGLSPLPRVLLVTLEDRFPAYADDGRPVDGVVVLGGAELPAITAGRGQPAFQEAGERILALADLSRRYPEARVVFTGASNALWSGPRLTESDTVQLALPLLGVPDGRVLFEAKARNTAENARFSRELAAPKPGERWLLVTSGYHMPRAMGCFRAAGFEVVAYPVDFRTPGGPFDWSLYSTVSNGLSDLDLVVREWIGLVVYRLTGRIPALFPAP